MCLINKILIMSHLSIFNRYSLFITGLLICTIIPEYLRGLYLWLGTIIAITISLVLDRLTFKLLIMSLAGGLGHSFIHMRWPFLDVENGYVQDISTFPDVFFHSLMLIFVWFNIRNKVSRIIQLITIFCIFGSILNCIFANYNLTKSSYHYLIFNNPYYLVFNLTTSFQAVSTAYWIAFALHYGEWSKRSFTFCLFLCNLVIVSNWFWYNCDDIFDLKIGLIKMSMKYRYIEGLFIISIWVPLLFNKTYRK